jgi:hypothetical protein
MNLAHADIRRLTPQRLTDFLDFFEQRAFADNPKWLSCYCHFPHAEHATIVWKDRSAAQNRAATCARIENQMMQGWLACADGQAIGWCNAGPRRLVEGLFDAPDPLAERIGAIAASWSPRPSAARAWRERGFEWAGAYPRSTTRGRWRCTPPPVSSLSRTTAKAA